MQHSCSTHGFSRTHPCACIRCRSGPRSGHHSSTASAKLVSAVHRYGLLSLCFLLLWYDENVDFFFSFLCVFFCVFVSRGCRGGDCFSSLLPVSRRMRGILPGSSSEGLQRARELVRGRRLVSLRHREEKKIWKIFSTS